MVKEWRPESWNADVWEDHDEDGDLEIINSDKSCWPAQLPLHQHLRRLTLNASGPPLSQQLYKTLLIPHESILTRPLYSRSINALKSQGSLNGDYKL